MVVLITVFQSISFLLAFLAAAILIWVNKDQQYSNRFLAMILLVLGLTNLNNVFLYQAWFLQFPYLHKFTLPLTFLIAPLAWVYTKSVLKGEIKSSKKDWFILAPTILCVIDLFPYYTMPLVEKKEYLIVFYKNPYLQAQFNEGILPPYIFSFIRLVWSAFFIAFNFKLIHQFKKTEAAPVLLNNNALIKWVTLFNLILVGLIMSSLINSIMAPLFKTDHAFVDLITGIAVFIICIRLFTQPRLLYGVYQPISGYSKEPLNDAILDPAIETDNNDNIMNQSESIRYKKIIESFFEQNSPFLQKDYTLEKLVIDTNLPRHTISAFINKEYGMGFREFLNRHRVNFFIDHIKNPEWENLTLEAIASECGYSNRSTFISNFKQITKQTPSEFIKNLSD